MIGDLCDGCGHLALARWGEVSPFLCAACVEPLICTVVV